MSRTPSPRAQIVLAFAAVYVIWGSTYLGIRVAIETLPALLMAGVRFIAAGLILFAVARRRRGPRDRLTAARWRTATIIGGCLLLGGNGGVSWGEQYLGSGFVALIVATVPLWMALLAPVFGGRRMNLTAGLGIGLGLAGLVLLLRPGGAGAGHWQTLVVLLAPLLWAIGSLYARSAPSPSPSQPLTATAMEMLAGGVLLVAAGAATGELGHVHLNAVSVASAVAFVYLVVAGALVGYVAYIWLLHHVTASAASTYAFVNPVVAVALGAIFLGEPVSASSLVAAGFIVAAVALILAGQPRAGARVERIDETPCPEVA